MMASRSEYRQVRVLTVERIDAARFRYQLDDGDKYSHHERGVLDAADRSDSLDARNLFHPKSGEEVIRRATRELAEAALPGGLRQEIERWAGAAPTHQRAVLVVRSTEHQIQRLPWELLPAALALDLFVVRSSEGSTDRRRATPELQQPSLRIAAWPVLPGGVRLPGVVREAQGLTEEFLSAGLDADVAISPDRESLDKLMANDPAIVHLAFANGFRHDPATGTTLALDPNAEDGTLQLLGSDTLIKILGQSSRLALCVVNSMPNPPTATTPLYEELSRALGIAVVGWAGSIEDVLASDFALFVYQRWLEGHGLVEAVRAFVEHYSRRQWVVSAMPVVWVPDGSWLEGPVFAVDVAPPEPASTRAASTRSAPDEVPMTTAPAVSTPATSVDSFGRGLDAASSAETGTGAPATAGAGTGDGAFQVEITFEPQPSLFPSLLINKQPILRRLHLQASQRVDVRLEIVCDAGGRSSVYRGKHFLEKGSNGIPLKHDDSRIAFPALYELIDRDERRTVTFEVTAYGPDGKVLDQQTRAATWHARREWLDSEDAWPYVPSFVLSMSRGVAELVRDAGRVLRQIGHPRDRFSGYPKNVKASADTVDGQMRALFQALRDRRLSYVTPPGSPVYAKDPALLDDRTTADPSDADPTIDAIDAIDASRLKRAGQIVRFPDDVFERQHATCHDLALLLAAAAEYVNLRPLILLLPGHTFFGVWLDSRAQDEFWRNSRQTRGGQFGDGWMIPPGELSGLLDGDDGPSIRLLETTFVTNPIATYELALREGDRLRRQDLLAVIDIRASRQEIQSLTLR